MCCLRALPIARYAAVVLRARGLGGQEPSFPSINLNWTPAGNLCIYATELNREKNTAPHCHVMQTPATPMSFQVSLCILCIGLKQRTP